MMYVLCSDDLTFSNIRVWILTDDLLPRIRGKRNLYPPQFHAWCTIHLPELSY